tara:strand:+ start:1097 stop:2026 length:930 start_codon:yes stop_codon:yes gene_type:complete
MKRIIILALIFLTACTTSIQPYAIQLEKDCTPEDLNLEDHITSLVDTKKGIFFIQELNQQQISQLNKNPCVKKTWNEKEARATYRKLSPEMQKQVLEKLEELNFQKSVINNDIDDIDEVRDILSNYQLYVTPNDPAVQAKATEISTKKEAYQESVNWVWISEQTLNQEPEKWLSPNEFLTKTPNYQTNPTNKIASDCSEQANTLTSLLRATGTSKENVRVVLGLVDFDGNVGGHAWVEVYEDGNWFQLDATSGPYYDDQSRKLVQSPGLDYNYFKFYPFPVIETWIYYNDIYFYDVEKGTGNAPNKWLN